MKLFILFFTLIISVSPVFSQSQFPPRNGSVDTHSLRATWSPPRNTIISQDFEFALFPPSGWSTTSEGEGWSATNNGTSAQFYIPPHTTYALASDYLAGQFNNGCCDRLITPTLDLTTYPGFKLVFQSYYTRARGEMAYVEISLDNGNSWLPIYEVEPVTEWIQIEVDLSAYSGTTGFSTVKLCFLGDDSGEWASGWAVDDVRVYTDDLAVAFYQCEVNDSTFLNTSDTSCQIPPAMATYGTSHEFKVAAVYPGGVSPYCHVPFTSDYLIPPTGLQFTTDSNQVFLQWNFPFDSTIGSIPSNISAFNIYRDGILILTSSGQSNYLELNSSNGKFVYEVSATYDLAPYGFTGYGESIKSEPILGEVNYGYPIPFYENWESQLFSSQYWSASSGWAIDSQTGNPSPSASFTGSNGLQNYDEFLQSFWINASAITTTTPYNLFLEFQLKLDDITSSGTEKLLIEVWNGSSWKIAESFVNAGSFDWSSECINISRYAKHRAFSFRFRAQGIESTSFQAWHIDSIKVNMQLELYPPQNLDAKHGPVGNWDDIYLSWTPPLHGGGEDVNYVLDDGSAENGWAINPGYESWLGNEFQTEDSGILTGIEIFWRANPSASNEVLSVDIFNQNHEYLGSSEEFIPAFEAWQTIPLPEIPFNTTFYAMVHWNMQVGESNYIASDENGPNAINNYGWYYDGNSWLHLSDYGYEPTVFLLRAQGMVGTDSPPQPGSILKPPVDNTAVPSGLSGFNIYHMIIWPGPHNDTLCPWTLIGTVPPDSCGFIEYTIDLSSDYYYRVTAQYDEGESIPSNIDKIWYVEIPENSPATVSLFPNPSDKITTIRNISGVNRIEVWNSAGAFISGYNLHNQTVFQLDTSSFPNGLYYLIIYGDKLPAIGRKLIVYH